MMTSPSRQQGSSKDAIMTCTKVASFLRVHLSSVRRWSRAGELKAYKVGSRGDWRYREQDVMAFLYDRQGHGANGGPDAQT